MNKIFFIAFFFMLGALIEFSCDKDEARQRDHPQIRTNAVNNISAEGARFNGSIISGDAGSITEYGFVWGTGEYLSLETSEKIIVQDVPDASTFSYDITFALEPMREYHVRSYIKSGDYTIYGDVVTFMSLGSQAPVINDFEPLSATWGDTITIYGTNFSYRNGTNSVLFGENNTLVVESTNEMLRVLVPNSLSDLSSYVSVEVLGNRTTSSEAFTLISPVIISST